MMAVKKLILIRGLVRSRRHWNKFPENLQAALGVNVTCVELPGNGYLSGEDTPQKIEDAIEILRAQAGANEVAGLVGISLGGMLAVRWAQMYPQEVSHLVLINTSSSLSPFHNRLLPRNYAGIVKTLLAGNPAGIEEFILNVSSNDESKWRPQLESNIAFQSQNRVRNANFLRQLMLTPQVDFKNPPACKKLLLVSEKDRLVNSSCSEVIAQKWLAPIRRHPSAGHDLPLDDEKWVIDQITLFLKDSAIASGE